MAFIDHFTHLYEIVRHQLSYMQLYNTQHVTVARRDRTSSVPKSVLRLIVDKGQGLWSDKWFNQSINIWELRDQMQSAWTTMILVHSSTALGDAQDTMVFSHEYTQKLCYIICSKCPWWDLIAGPSTPIESRKQHALDRSATIPG